jgi:phosphoglucosamine mutase
MLATSSPLSELAAPYQAYPQVLLNVPVARKPPLDTLPEVSALVTEIETALAGDGRVLLRYSGTESLARVMVEGPDAGLIQDQAERVADKLRAELGA